MKILNERASGILMHITSLPSEYGIGDLGSSSFDFIDFLRNSCQSFWQVLPLNPTSSSRGNSPYASSSAFAGNTLLISPAILHEDGLLMKKDIEGLKTGKNTVDYNRVIDSKGKIFDAAFRAFRSKKSKLLRQYEDFCLQNGNKWLDDFADFTVFREYFHKKFNISSWNKWPAGIKNRNRQELAVLKNELAVEIKKEKFLQFIFFKQWINIRGYASKSRIRIIGDLPIYVDYESSDVWSNPYLFKLDKDRQPEFVSGVPPDYFSCDGQLWNNPVFDWEELESRDFYWWNRRIEHNLKLFDSIRIDHFRGLVAYWEIPQGSRTAKIGKWVKGRPQELFQNLSRKFKTLPLIAENLGVITPDVTWIMEKFGFPGVKVLQFGFGKDFPHSEHLPRNINKNCLVYTGTHDNNTVRGWFEEDASCTEKKNLSEYLGKEVSAESVGKDLIKLAMASRAALTIIPMQDILKLDSKARMNQPSIPEGNWRWRADSDMLNKSVEEELCSITFAHGRKTIRNNVNY
jgi:4-alpha-glucanotransferase